MFVFLLFLLSSSSSPCFICCFKFFDAIIFHAIIVDLIHTIIFHLFFNFIIITLLLFYFIFIYIGGSGELVQPSCTPVIAWLSLLVCQWYVCSHNNIVRETIIDLLLALD